MAALAPPEILDQVFSELSPVDLQNVRLVCPSFALSAARHLFRKVFIWPNKECLQNLDRITSHPAFRKYVRSVVYSERVFPLFGDFDDWRFRLSTSTKTLENLEDYYQAYVLRTEYEKDLRANGILKRKLTRALALMPSLEHVYVNPLIHTRGDKASILRVSQETLCEPLLFAEDSSATSKQRCEMLESLCDSNSQIKVLEGRLLGRETLDHPSAPLHSLGRRIRRLTLRLFGYEHYSTVCLVGLMQVLEKAIGLETLELSFYVREVGYAPVVLFDQIWPNVVHYSSLKCLSLTGFRMSQLRLLGVLSLHASTLRSLQLIDIDFEWKEARDNICAGSWTDTIHFLEEHLNLTRAEFVGVLTNRWNEAWFFEDKEDHIICGCQNKPLTETLKYRIEQYVVEGGICPLDLPRGREHDKKMDYWLEIGDCSFRFHPEDCDPSIYDDE